jgi:hypothetical protein
MTRFLIMIMEAVCSSETSVNYHRNTGGHNLEQAAVSNRSPENKNEWKSQPCAVISATAQTKQFQNGEML